MRRGTHAGSRRARRRRARSCRARRCGCAGSASRCARTPSSSQPAREHACTSGAPPIPITRLSPDRVGALVGPRCCVRCCRGAEPCASRGFDLDVRDDDGDVGEHDGSDGEHPQPRSAGEQHREHAEHADRHRDRVLDDSCATFRVRRGRKAGDRGGLFHSWPNRGDPSVSAASSLRGPDECFRPRLGELSAREGTIP